MRFGDLRAIEDVGGLREEELSIVGVLNEPAQFGRERLDQVDIREQSVIERGFRDPVVARFGGVRNEIAALEAFLQR